MWQQLSTSSFYPELRQKIGKVNAVKADMFSEEGRKAFSKCLNTGTGSSDDGAASKFGIVVGCHLCGDLSIATAEAYHNGALILFERQAELTISSHIRTV